MKVTIDANNGSTTITVSDENETIAITLSEGSVTTKTVAPPAPAKAGGK